jgi:hypothetical protein
MSPGVEFDKNTMLLTQTSQADFENLCRLDVLGLADSSENDQDVVYDDFKENLMRNQAGWYETNLPWKTNHPDLPTNETGSRRRLNNLVKRLERNGTYQRYDDIIQDQLEQKIIELAPAEVTGKEFYIPHKGIVRQSAQTTKLRIVYDASARGYPDILPKDTLPKDILPKDILPNGHFADGRFAERTFCRTEILPNGHCAERTVCRKDNLPKIEMLFRQNVWDCASFLNFIILNHCVK